MSQASVKSSGGRPFLHVVTVTPAGTSQSTAASIPNSSPGVILAAGNSWNGVVLPTAGRGKTFWVKNTGTTELGGLRVFPASGDSINALAADAYLEMEENTSAMFVAISSTVWYTFPALPS